MRKGKFPEKNSWIRFKIFREYFSHYLTETVESLEKNWFSSRKLHRYERPELDGERRSH